MSAVNLLQPILDGGVQRNNFFNGRLLSAEDLRAEQDANRLQRGHLARAIGDGVAWGLDVSIASATELKVTVRKGLALNRHLDLLSLVDDTEVALVPAAPTATSVGTGVFAECDPPRASAAYTGAGAYVLVAAPASGYKGTALISDPNTTAAGRGACGARFSVEGVRFRLVPMVFTRFAGMDSALIARIVQLLPPPIDASRERLRNLLAHLCFGTQQLGGYFADPLAPNGKEMTWSGWGAVDAMRDLGDLSDCDVPLALVVLTSSRISFVDMWPVRRRIIGAGAVATWRGVAGPRRVSEAEAAFLQFQTQLDVVKTLAPPVGITADSYFDVLPSAGWLPIGMSGFDWTTFLGAHAPPAATPVDAALVRGIIERSWLDEPFALATAPPVPLRVYEVPGAPYVVFARSTLGNVRVALLPVPTAGEAVEVQLTAKTGTAVHGSTIAGGRITIPEIAPGVQVLTITAPDYLPVPASDVFVIGGRTVDVQIALTPQPNGSILVDAVDKATDDRIAASKMLNITATGGGKTFTAVAKGGKWLFEDLPAETYEVTGTATGYKSATSIAVGPTAKGTVLDVVLRFEPSVHAADQPPQCISLAKTDRQISNARVCMILKATEFEERYFYRGERKGEAAIANDKFRIAGRRNTAKERGARYVTSSGEIVYSDAEPWRRMMPIKEPSDAVQRWLREWRDYIADELSVEAVRKARPQIYVDANYRLPKSAAEVSVLPPAYAVFGPIAVPLAIHAEDGITRLPVALDQNVLPWVMLETFEALSGAGIRHLNDLAWAWRELVIDATGDPADTAPYLIFDALTAVMRVNGVRGYYPGLTPAMDATLKSHGYPTDHSLANATPDELMKHVGNRGFAVRLIYEARQIVPKSSWSLEVLPFTVLQVELFYLLGIESQGALVQESGKAEGKQRIAKTLGISEEPQAKVDEHINAVVNEAVKELTFNAVLLSPTISLALWSGIDPATAANLEKHNIRTLDDFAHADEDIVAEIANLPKADAKALITKAKAESLTEASVEAVLAITASEGTELTKAFVGEKATLDGLTKKTAVEMTDTFGGEARAGAVLNGLKDALRNRGIR